MARVVSVVKAAIRNSWKRKKPANSGGYDGPVNLPDGIAAAMRKTHSYMWLDNAVKEEEEVGGGESRLILLPASRSGVPRQSRMPALRLCGRPLLMRIWPPLACPATRQPWPAAEQTWNRSWSQGTSR